MFPKRTIDCLQPVAGSVRNEEQTQELRIPEAMPDVGRVLCTWGQGIIRGKEWHTGEMTVSGGVMVWVLYAPEDGGEPRTVETWLPFQLRWELPETQRDGSILVNCLLRSVDARSVSPRKLMVRAGVSVAAQAMEPKRMEISQLGELPDDVQLRKSVYPMQLPREAGEKTFLIDEEITASGLDKPVYALVQPEIAEKKVVGDKLVFRGMARLYVPYRGEEGEWKTWQSDTAFSQLVELEQEYAPGTGVLVTPVVTNLELQREDSGTMRLKAGITGQYILYETQPIELVEDAYSPDRTVQVHWGALTLPALLDESRELLHIEQQVETGGAEALDAFLCAEQPTVRRDGDSCQLTVPGQLQLLYRDAEGKLQGKTERWEGTVDYPCDSSVEVRASAAFNGFPQIAKTPEGADVRGSMALDIQGSLQKTMPMVTGLELGEPQPRDAARPSLLLRRMDDGGLWELAKRCGSTVDAITAANRLTEEPKSGQLLLIPIP